MSLGVVFFTGIGVQLFKVILQVVAQTIKSCLDTLPGFPRTQIGFITFDSTVHFYNIKVSDFFGYIVLCHLLCVLLMVKSADQF